MGRTFESQQGYGDDLEIGLDSFEFKSAGKKYINQNYKRIGAILGVEGEGLGVIKKQANRENKLPDMHGEIGLEQINFYRAHYDFSPLTQDEYETVKAQNTSSEAIIDEQVEEVTEVEKTDINISSEEGVELIKKLTRKDFGSIPEDPYNIKNNDLEALNQLFNSKNNEFPNNQYVDIRNWSDWTPITVVKSENTNDSNPKWSITKGNNNELIGEFDSEQKAETEFKRIKDIDKQRALGLLRKARNFAIGEENLDAPWTDSVDVSAETVIKPKSLTPLAEEGADVSSSVENTTQGKELKANEVVDPKVVEEQGEETPLENEELANLPEAEVLQAELDRLVDDSVEKENHKVIETIGKLARIEGREYTGEPDMESNLSALELDILREKAQEAILDYQNFHKSFRKEYRTPAIQEQYRKLEKEAWDKVEELAHKLGGRIIELPRGLEFSKEYNVDIDSKTRDRLNSDLGYKFNKEGQITNIEINGNTIQLNRPRTVDELLNGDRPARILYHSGDQILDEDPSKKHYKGYWIKGLNPNTIQDIERELSGNKFPQPDIIDDTITPSDIIDDPNSIQYYRNLEPIDLSETNTTQEPNGLPIMPIFQVESGVPNFESKDKYSLEDKSKQDPWSAESRGEIEFEKIFANSINRNKDSQGDNEIPDPRVEQAEGGETTLQVSLDDLRGAYAKAEEAWNRKRGDEELKDIFESAREAYNTELERVLKLQVSEGQEANIHKIFKDEVIALRDSRIDQSQELQGKWEKRLNPIKEKFVNFVMKHKKLISRLNLAAGVAGGALALTGVGIPLAGGLAVARRMVSATLLGVSTGEGIRSLGEDADINSFWGKIKFQAVIPKLVQESLASSEDEFKQVSADILKERLGTLEAYYRLNGGKFSNDNQQQAYEKVLTELARRVQENVIDVENPTLSIQPLTTEQLEKNKKLYGWEASYELAKIAKSQNVDLSLLSREDYADFAIQNKLMIEDNQLRMSPWQRMCESVDEVRKGDKERQALINPEADKVFDKFSLEIRQKAGEIDRNIDDNIIVRQGTNNSEHWLYFGINQGADSGEDQIFKSYISLQDLNTLTPDKFTDFMKALRDSGYNGDIKVFQDLLSQGIRLNDQIVMHGASEADAKLGLDVADQFFGDSLTHKSLGIDKKINGKSYSYSQVLAQKIKNYIQDSSSVEEQNPSTEVLESGRQKLETDRYASELLNTISNIRITELDKFRRNRKIATGTGIVVGLLAGGAVHILDEVNKPESANLTDGADTTSGATLDTQGPGVGPEVSETGADAPKLNLDTTPPSGTGAGAEEALRQAQEAATAEQAQELAQDISSLDSGETIWGEITKQLGPDASQAQIRQAVENYLQSELGQESVYKLAQGTEDGRELLAQWGIDNADAMVGLSKEQLFEISRYLAPGELEGITELSLDNLESLTPSEYSEPSPVVESTVESAATEPTVSPSAESPLSSPAPEVPPVTINEFTRGVSEVLGTTNLTESQLQEAIYSFATSEQGSVDLYNQIISNEEGARFLSGFGVNKAADFANLRPDEVYEIAQTVGVENLDKLPGFELNDIILSKFEDAPDMIELSRGTRPLDIVQRYIAGETGNLPYDSNLGKQVLDTYVQTDAGKQWLYDAIVSNPNPNNQNVQLFREYLSFKGIKSAEDFKELFNWSEFSGNRNIPTSAFWNQIRLPNGGARLQPLSTFLQPSKMIGIKDAVRQVLTR